MIEEWRGAVPRINSHWLGEKVRDEIQTDVAHLPRYLPSFQRVSLGRNRYKDVVVRRLDRLPAGVVSKRYLLIQHLDVVRDMITAAGEAGIDAAPLGARLTITEYGTRMALRVLLPPEFALKAADGHEMALTFECFNSVDGTVPLYALVGWFRLVCGNGLAVGTTTARLRQKHVQGGETRDFTGLLAAGIKDATVERHTFQAWAETPVRQDALASWVDHAVAKTWGPAAATRIFNIATRGLDGTPRQMSKKIPPHRRHFDPQLRVPGTQAPCRDKYAVAQVLAWIASRRQSVAERDTWRAEIGSLIQQLAKH